MEYLYCTICAETWTEKSDNSLDIECPNCMEHFADGDIEIINREEYAGLN